VEKKTVTLVPNTNHDDHFKKATTDATMDATKEELSTLKETPSTPKDTAVQPK
jgi:hypothetical protein